MSKRNDLRVTSTRGSYFDEKPDFSSHRGRIVADTPPNVICLTLFEQAVVVSELRIEE